MQKPASSILFRVFALLLALAWPIVAPGQDAEQAGATASDEAQAVPTVQEIQSRIAALEAESAEPLDSAVRLGAIEAYRSALEQLSAADTHRVTAEQRQAATALADGRVSEYRWQIFRTLSTDVLGQYLSDLPDLAEMEQALGAIESRLSALNQTIAEQEAERDAVASQTVPLREQIAALHDRALQLRADQESPAAGSDPLQQARSTLLSTRIAALHAERSALEAELDGLPAREAVASAYLASARIQHAKLDEAAQALAQQISARKRADAASQLTQSQREAAQAAQRHPLLAAYAEQTAVFSRQLSDTTDQAEALIGEQADSANRLALFEENRASLDQVLAIGAAGDDFSDLLRELRARIPATAAIQQQISLRDKTILDIRLQLLRVREHLRSLSAADEARQAVVADWKANNPQSPAITPETRAELVGLMVSRRDVLERLEVGYASYLERLIQVNEIDRELVAGGQALSQTLEERLLWVPSAAPVGPLWLERIGLGLDWVLSPAGWREAGRTLVVQARQRFPRTLLVFGVAVVCLLCRGRLIRRYAQIASRVEQVWKDSLWLTMQALLLALVLPLPLSLLLGWSGYLLDRSSNGVFVTALGSGLLHAAILLYGLRLLQEMCRDQGLFDVHFRWPSRVRGVLVGNLRWLIVVLPLTAGAVHMAEASGQIYYQNGLGRLAFMLGSLALAVFVCRVLHPRLGVLSAVLSRTGLIWRLRLVWFTALSAAPVVLGVFAALGYYATALRIQGQLLATASALLVGLIAYAVTLRWLAVAQRRLAFARAREQREKQLSAANENPTGSGEALPQIEVSEIDLPSASSQTRAVLRAVAAVGFLLVFYLIWQDLIPALSVLDEVTVWSSTSQTPEGPEVSQVTVWSLILAVASTTLTLIAARNLPGIIEISALRRLSIDAGTRYAITAISRYLIITVGLLIAFNQVGIGWGKAQFVVAALGVGLGFGLQEIVANFVSGVIILFERPIRIGDAVTVNDLSGIVARIQIRATTIIDWDNREILVPNKSFITSNVTNWTLTDPVTRIVFPVGVAYGSDAAQVHAIISKVIEDHPLVLDQPAPSVFFAGFGDSSLDFEVRAFVKDVQQRFPTRHALHLALEKALREAGIEIPFPQRDLHLRSSDFPLFRDQPPAGS